MRCQTCDGTGTARYNSRAGGARGEDSRGFTINAGDALPGAPCHDCGGTGIAHCCEGMCEQPGAENTRPPDIHFIAEDAT